MSKTKSANFLNLAPFFVYENDRNIAHQIRPSGAGWVCTCEHWGWTDAQAIAHLEYFKTTRAEKAIDAAFESNCG